MNILDVAAAAGVSSATVSRVLNGGKVTPETTAKVEAAIRKLNYFPNNLARTLITGKSMNIGIVTHSLTNSFSMEFVDAVSQRLSELDYRLFVTSSGTNGMSREDVEAKYLSSFLSQKVDGIILHDPSMINYESGFYGEIAKQVPFVMVHSSSQVTDINSVLIDQVLGMQKVMDHLLGQGHRRIWMVRSHGYSQDLKEAVWRSALRAVGMEPSDDDVINSPQGDAEIGITNAEEWVSRRLARSEPPTAIFAANDIQGIGVKAALLGAGLRIPEDVSLIAHDNTILAEIGQFSSVDMKRASAGHATVDLLLSCIRGRDKEIRRVYLTPDLIHRGSTRPLPGFSVV
jgi:DNA-binding LacI/PurR family transcriptional regulator